MRAWIRGTCSGATVFAAVAFLATLSGCGVTLWGRDPVQEELQRQEEAAKLADRAPLDKIMVLPSDSSRPYEVLGRVEVSAPQEIFDSCKPDDLRRVALERFGDKVDAIVGYTATTGPTTVIAFGASTATTLCEGYAVRWLAVNSNPSPPPATR